MSPALDGPIAKPRNKLRKLSKRRPDSIASNGSPRASTDSRRDSSEAHAKQVPKSPSCRTSIPPPPDLSDPKWQEYVRKSGVVLPMEKSPRLKQTSSPSPSTLIPELAHLAVTRPPKVSIQPSNSAEELPPLPSPQSTLSSLSSSSIMRRYAKTPVTRIGQLEGEPSPTRPGHKASDAESIAGQYRALLGSRSYEDIQEDAEKEQDEEEWYDAQTRQNSLDTIRSAVSRRSPLPPTPLQRESTPPGLDFDVEGSPTSDGTLVDFEEDAIYFKPAFSPEALSPIPEDDDYSPPWSPPPRADSLSLQITMELLTKELAGSLRRNNRRQPGAADVPSLQTWLMIEAYEKLRDQVSDMHLPSGETHALQDMFDVWLRALYRVHEGLVEARAKTVYVPEEGEVAELQTVDLD